MKNLESVRLYSLETKEGKSLGTVESRKDARELKKSMAKTIDAPVHIIQYNYSLDRMRRVS